MLTYLHLDRVALRPDGQATVTVTQVTRGRPDGTTTWHVGNAAWNVNNPEAINRLVAHQRALDTALDEYPPIPLTPTLPDGMITVTDLVTYLATQASTQPVLIPSDLHAAWKQLVDGTHLCWEGEPATMMIYPAFHPLITGSGMRYKTIRWHRPPGPDWHKPPYAPVWAGPCVAAITLALAWDHPDIAPPVFTGDAYADIARLSTFITGSKPAPRRPARHGKIRTEPIVTPTTQEVDVTAAVIPPDSQIDAIPPGATVILSGWCHADFDLIRWAVDNQIQFTTPTAYRAAQADTTGDTAAGGIDLTNVWLLISNPVRNPACRLNQDDRTQLKTWRDRINVAVYPPATNVTLSAPINDTALDDDEPAGIPGLLAADEVERVLAAASSPTSSSYLRRRVRSDRDVPGEACRPEWRFNVVRAAQVNARVRANPALQHLDPSWYRPAKPASWTGYAGRFVGFVFKATLLWVLVYSSANGYLGDPSTIGTVADVLPATVLAGLPGWVTTVLASTEGTVAMVVGTALLAMGWYDRKGTYRPVPPITKVTAVRIDPRIAPYLPL